MILKNSVNENRQQQDPGTPSAHRLTIGEGGGVVPLQHRRQQRRDGHVVHRVLGVRTKSPLWPISGFLHVKKTRQPLFVNTNPPLEEAPFPTTKKGGEKEVTWEWIRG